MRKLFVCDFDGTLHKKNNERQFKAVMEEVGKLRAKGNEFVVATGRPLHLLKPFFKDFDNMLFISNDGAVFSKGFGILYSQPIDKSVVKERFCNYKGGFLAYGQCITYANYREKSTGFKLDEFYGGHVMRIGCVGEISEDIYKVSFIGSEPDADFLDKCWCSYGINEYVAKGVSKGSCLRLVQKALGFTAENTVVIGDGENDISMMECADISYAMMSAPPRVKANATRVAENVLDILRGEG